MMHSRALAGNFPLSDGVFGCPEVPYQFLAEMPAIVAYARIQMAEDASQRFLRGVFYTSWAQKLRRRAIIGGRRGSPLRLADPLLRGMDAVGLLALCYGHDPKTRNLRNLLQFIRAIHWTVVRDSGRLLPRDSNLYTPIYNNGDQVPFNSDR